MRKEETDQWLAYSYRENICHQIITTENLALHEDKQTKPLWGEVNYMIITYEKNSTGEEGVGRKL